MVSNYLNHHQIPFCRAMCGETEGDFRFIQTEPMEEERLGMGWREEAPPYRKLSYEEPRECARLILESDVVIFGGCEEESYLAERLKSRRPVMRYSERLYKSGQWKAATPRGLLRKYLDHTRYRKAPVCLLCAGAYVPSDFHIIRAYPGKMYRWGYFPETRSYDIAALMEQKEKATPSLLWAGRFLDWKHPELPLRAARRLKETGLDFHLDLLGGGALEPMVRTLTAQYGLERQVTLQGCKTPEEVRSFMEKADVFLLTSDRREGWGAVVNEAMNSGCAIAANHMAGAVPFLIRHGENGLIYQDGNEEQLFALTGQLVRDAAFRKRLGTQAYRTITEEWNAETAAANLMALFRELEWLEPPSGGKAAPARIAERAPGSPAPVVSERRMLTFLAGEGGRP
jgi:glycosyltransferase involved in cell wall biosynthesis